jgi:signal transduction histidine kinase
VEQWSAPLRDVFATGRSRRVEFSFPGVGGEQRFEAMLTPERDCDGTVVSVLSVTRDVTERHRAARTLGLLARTSDVVVSSLEPADMLAAFAELLIEDFAESCAVDLLSAHGDAVERVALATRDPARGVRIRNLDALYPTPPEAPIAPAMVMRSGEPALFAEVTEAQLRAASRDETHLTLLRELGAASVLCVPLRARGRTLGAVTLVNHTPQRSFSNSDLALAVQLTERVALALDNARLYAEAVAASRTKSTFLATMSHELRTPLNAILGYADIMAVGIGGALSETQQLHLDRIQASARHLLAIIEGLLSFTRLEAGGDRVHGERVELGELVAQALEMVRPAADAKQLELRGEVDAAVEIETDRSKLLQILLNLLGNAVKFTTRGGITTAIGVDVATGEALVRVGDTSIGIEEQDLERIFEPFWQVESGMTRRLGGTGLGLTVSRQIAELLGGTLHVESVAGHGSVFTIRLPRRAAAAIVAATAAATEPR